MNTSRLRDQKPSVQELEDQLANAPKVLDPPDPYRGSPPVRRTLAERIRRVDPTMAQRYYQRSGE